MQLRGHARVRRRRTRIEQYGEIFVDAVLEFETITIAGARRTTILLASAKAQAAEVLSKAPPGARLFIRSGHWWTERRETEDAGFVLRARLFQVELVEQSDAPPGARKRPRGGAERRERDDLDSLEF